MKKITKKAWDYYPNNTNRNFLLIRNIARELWIIILYNWTLPTSRIFVKLTLLLYTTLYSRNVWKYFSCDVLLFGWVLAIAANLEDFHPQCCFSIVMSPPECTSKVAEVLRKLCPVISFIISSSRKDVIPCLMNFRCALPFP